MAARVLCLWPRSCEAGAISKGRLHHEAAETNIAWLSAPWAGTRNPGTPSSFLCPLLVLRRRDWAHRVAGVTRWFAHVRVGGLWGDLLVSQMQRSSSMPCAALRINVLTLCFRLLFTCF